MVLLRDEDAGTVRRSLITLNDRVRAAQSLPNTETLLFVYYSGHADARALWLRGARLEIRELPELVRGSAATFRVLVVDACRSGGLTRVKGARPVPVFDVAPVRQLPRFQVLDGTATTQIEEVDSSAAVAGKPTLAL